MIDRDKLFRELEDVLEKTLINFTDKALAREDMSWPAGDEDDPLHEVYGQVWSDMMRAMRKLVDEIAEYTKED